MAILNEGYFTQDLFWNFLDVACRVDVNDALLSGIRAKGATSRLALIRRVDRLDDFSLLLSRLSDYLIGVLQELRHLHWSRLSHAKFRLF